MGVRKYVLGRKPKLRSDPAGDGSFNAPRGNRIHEAIDVVVDPGEVVYAHKPLTYVRRINAVYGNGVDFQGAVFLDDFGNVYRFLYMLPDQFTINENVRAGQRIGIAQDVSSRYPHLAMLPHLHIDATSPSGQRIDITDEILA